MKGSISPRPGKNGTKTWFLRVNAGRDVTTGKRRQTTRTVHGGKADADRELRRLIRDVEAGAYVRSTGLTVAELLERWLDAVSVSVRPNTFESYCGPLRAYAIPAMGRTPAAKLTPERIATLYRDLLNTTGRRSKRPLSRRTVGMVHRLLSMAFNWGLTQQLVALNPVRAVIPPQVRHAELQVLDASMFSSILTILQGRSTWAVPVVAFAVRTGARRGEILGLQWRDVDLTSPSPSVVVRRSLVLLDSGAVVIGAPKTDKGKRAVFLDRPSVELLRRRREEADFAAALIGRSVRPTDHVFGDPEGKRLRPDSLSRAFARAAKKAGAPNATFHGLRHLHATELLRAGMHPRIVQERLGHGDVTVTLNTYSHVVPGLQERAAETFDEAFPFAMPAPEKQPALIVQ